MEHCPRRRHTDRGLAVRCLAGWLGVACLLSTATAQEVTIPVTADSWTFGLADTNPTGGGTDDLRICPRANYWIYLQFDLGGLTDHVVDAELRLTRFDGDRPEEISLYAISDDNWNEETLTGAARPAPTDPLPSATMAQGEEGDDFDRWRGVRLTAAVERERQGDGVLTLMVREDPDDDFDVRNYFSREGARTDSEQPQLVVTLDTSETIDANWRSSIVGIGTKPSFAYGPDGSIHAMGMSEEGDGFVWHASAGSPAGPWFPANVAEGYFYGPGDIAVDSDNTVHLAWHNHDDEDPEHVTVRDGLVQRYPIETPGSHNGWDNALTLDAEGTLYQSSVNPSAFGAVDSLEYGVFDGSDWTYEPIVESGSFMYGLNTSIAVDSDGKIHIAYCQANDWTAAGDLKYAVRDGDGWTISTVVTDGPRGRFPSLVLDHWGRPHIAWLDAIGNDSAHVRYGVLNSEEWVVEDIDILENVDFSFGGARKSVALTLDPNYRPSVAYCDTNVVKYAEKPFGDWEITPVLTDTDGDYKGLAVLRRSPVDDRPAIVFWEAHREWLGLVRFAYPNAVTTSASQRLGDCNQDATLDIGDPVCLLQQLFGDSPEFPCGDGTLDAAANVTLLDFDEGGAVDATDALALLNFLFLSGSPPVAGLGCVEIEGCSAVCE